MAAENGRQGGDLGARLFGEPHRFDFFQAVRLVRWLAREKAQAEPEWASKPVGENAPPDQEGLRFRSLPALSFPAAPVARLRAAERDGPPSSRKLLEMVVTFMGLTGPSGVLPQHYTTLLLQRVRAKDTHLRDFLDLFNHRLVSLFYRAWEKYRLPLRLERCRRESEAAEDLTQTVLYSLVGLGTKGLRDRLEIPDPALLFYGGHFSHSPRSAAALEAVLRDYFQMPIAVLSLHGQWLYLGSEDRSRLSLRGRRRGQNNQMGIDLIVGRGVWDVQSKFRLRTGPLRYAQYRRLMPNGDMLRPLGQMTRRFVGPELDFDVQPVLKAAEVPRCRLLSRGERSFLGWNTWVHGRPMSRDPDDAVFTPKGI